MMDTATMRSANERMAAAARNHIKEILKTYELREMENGQEVVVLRNSNSAEVNKNRRNA